MPSIMDTHIQYGGGITMLTSCFISAPSFRSFGVFLYELVTNGSVPYASFSNQQVRSKVTEGYRLPQPHNCPDELYSLMLHCWLPRATERPNFSDIVHSHLDPLKVKVHEGRLNRQNSTSDEAEGKRYCLSPPLLPPSPSLSFSFLFSFPSPFISPLLPLSRSLHLSSLTPSLPLPQCNSQTFSELSQTETERAVLPSGAQ